MLKSKDSVSTLKCEIFIKLRAGNFLPEFFFPEPEVKNPGVCTALSVCLCLSISQLLIVKVYLINFVFLQQEDMEGPRELTFEKDPPAIEWHITGDPDKFDILTV